MMKIPHFGIKPFRQNVKMTGWPDHKTKIKWYSSVCSSVSRADFWEWGKKFYFFLRPKQSAQVGQFALFLSLKWSRTSHSLALPSISFFYRHFECNDFGWHPFESVKFLHSNLDPFAWSPFSCKKKLWAPVIFQNLPFFRFLYGKVLRNLMDGISLFL